MTRLLFEEIANTQETKIAKRLQVLILNQDREQSKLLKRCMEPYVQKLSVANHLDDSDMVNQVDIIFIDTNMGGNEITEISKHHSRIVVTGEWIDPEDKQYMRKNLGIRSFIEQPFSEKEILSLLEIPSSTHSSMFSVSTDRTVTHRKRGDNGLRSSSSLGVGPKINTIQPEGVTQRSPFLPFIDQPKGKKEDFLNLPFQQEKIHHQMTTFFSPKGGVGKSTLSLLTAWNLNIVNPNLKICVVDMDLYRGNIAYMLGIDRPKVTIYDWVGIPEEASDQVIEEHLIKHSSGLYVLPAPADLRHISAIDRSVTEKVFMNLKNAFDVIIVDTGYVLDDAALVSFDFSSRINMVTILDRPSLKDTYQVIQEMSMLGVPLESLRLLFNMVKGDEKLPVKQLSEGFEVNHKIVPTTTVLPYEKLIYQSINQNKILNYQEHKKGFAKEALKIIEDIAQFQPPKPTKKFSFNFFRKR